MKSSNKQKTEIAAGITLLGIVFCVCVFTYGLMQAVCGRMMCAAEHTYEGVVLVFPFIVTQGTVVGMDEKHTIVSYYYYADNIWANRVFYHVTCDPVEGIVPYSPQGPFKVGEKVPVVYTYIDSPGSCRVVGYYRNYALAGGIVGVAAVILGTVLKILRKRKE